MFLKILQYSQENTCVRVSFYKVAGLQAWGKSNASFSFVVVLLSSIQTQNPVNIYLLKVNNRNTTKRFENVQS